MERDLRQHYSFSSYGKTKHSANDVFKARFKTVETVHGNSAGIDQAICYHVRQIADCFTFP
jgi:hypothetical protein